MAELLQLALAEQKGPKALIKTNRGDILVQLFPEVEIGRASCRERV